MNILKGLIHVNVFFSFNDVVISANTSSLYNDMLDENLEIPNLINFLGTSINLTCRASLEEWRSAKSILVEVGKQFYSWIPCSMPVAGPEDSSLL